MSFQSVRQFEDAIAKFFGAPYGVAVDSCTHAIELCLRYKKVKKITIPNRTYLSIAFLGDKLGIEWDWKNENWQDYYYLGETNIVDAAVLWRRNSYIPNTMMCLSFQYQKHLNIGRGGMVLIDNQKDKDKLKKMSYDGRIPDVPWREQNIDQVGYHYYMTPETAELGLKKLPAAINKKPRKWVIKDWPDLSKMEIFK